MPKPDYDTSLARMAGNIAAGLIANPQWRGSSVRPLRDYIEIADYAVLIASEIVEQIRERARPPADQEPT